MGTDEEYLDSLLKSIADGKKRPKEAGLSPDDSAQTAQEKVDDMQSERGDGKEDPILNGQSGTEDPSPAMDMIPGESEDDSDEWKINIDQLLEQADMLVSNDMLPPLPGFDAADDGTQTGDMTFTAPPQESVRTDIPDRKVREMEKVEKTMNEAPSREMENQDRKAGPEAGSDVNSEGFPDMDSDLDEINSLLQQADLNEKVDEDMLALLESATDIHEDDENLDEVFDIFADADMSMEGGREESAPKPREEEEEPEDKKASKKKKKKKEKGKKKSSGMKDDSDEEKEKKPGLFAKIKEMLAQKDDLDLDSEEAVADPVGDRNAKLLNDLKEAEEKKPAKSAKKDKKKAGGKGGKNAKEAKPKKAKAAKPKKDPARKKEAAKPAVKEKPVKILNGKSFVAILGLCLSVIAGVMIVTTFLPAYANTRNARAAYRNGDYKTVYRLLYNKKLSGNEELIYNQSRTIMQLERRLSSYQNNIMLGRELEAVDALMMGVWSYQELTEADTYNVRSQVDALYQQICSILESNYGVTREQAIELNGYDEIEYTRALYSIAGGNGISSGQNVSGAEAFSGAADGGQEQENAAAREQEAGQSGEDALPEGQEGSETDPEDGAEADEQPEDLLPAEEDILDQQ